MPDSSPSEKKRKITIVASPEGLKIAKKALVRLGFDTKSNFAESQRLSRSVVSKFFNRQPIQVDSFKKICKILTLNWSEIVELQDKDKKEGIEEEKIESSLSIEAAKPVSVSLITRKVIAIDEQGQEIKTATVILEGEINSVNTDILFWRDVFLKQYPGTTLKVISIKQGSIKLIIEGTQKDVEMLLSDVESGNLIEVEGFPVKNVQLLSESTEDDESSEEKWRLVEEIITNPIKRRDLSGADLSDADLSNACLIAANLSDADLSDSDLSGANLTDANLTNADLSSANLSNANLSNANLSGTRIDPQTKLDGKWRLLRADLTNEPGYVLTGDIASQIGEPPVSLGKTLVNLSQWLKSVFEEGLQTIEELLNTQQSASAYRGNEAPRWQQTLRLGQIDPENSTDVVCRVIPIELGTGHLLNLIVTIRPEVDNWIYVLLQVFPNQAFLPPNLQLRVLDESSEIVLDESNEPLETHSKSEDNLINLQFSVPPGEQFSVQVALGDNSITQQFVT